MTASAIDPGLTMELAALVRDLPVTGDVPAGVTVGGVQHDSRTVEAGDLFVALAGQRHDGARFAPAAIAQGAVAVVARSPRPADVDAAVPWLHTDDPRALLAPLSSRLYGRPDREMLMIGVTGTNGKSTFVWLMESILEAAGLPTGKLGTVGGKFADLDLASARTTPEAPELVRLLRQLRQRGAEAVTMEVSSHSLVLGRVSELRYDVAVFTNLSRDHLDYHRTMEEYFAAKRRLFDLLKPGGRGAVNVGDAWGRKLAAELGADALTFGLEGDVEAHTAELDRDGIRATVRTPRGEIDVVSPLTGDYNLENVLAAVSAAEILDLPLAAIQEGISRMRGVPGRLERVEAGQPFPIVVDYAHTPDALRRLLDALRETTGCRLISVFGSPGERDAGKRPLMGETAAEHADYTIVTSDNPRSEDAADIAAAIAGGLQSRGAPHRVILDRREALRAAVAAAGPGWAVVVTGKGNETGQQVGGEKLPHDDREELARAVADGLASTAPVDELVAAR